jgi:UDP-N-acetylglucosamine acyltransferase
MSDHPTQQSGNWRPSEEWHEAGVDASGAEVLHAEPGVEIQPTAIVDSGAEIGTDVKIGHGAIVGPHVRLGDRVRIGAHVVLTGHTRIGDDTRIWPGAIIGEEPQDSGFVGGESYVDVGPRCRIREYATVHRGSTEGSTTQIGPDCLMMTLSHVAHDCRLAKGVTISNGTLLAGYVIVDEAAFISGNTAVQQFVRVGTRAFLGGLTRVPRDVAPYLMLAGDAVVTGINWVGLRRAGVSRVAQKEIKAIYEVLHDRGEALFDDRVARIQSLATTPEGREVAAFLGGKSRRGYCRP